MKSIRRLTLALLVLFSASLTVSAQAFEIHPYAGGVFPDTFDLGQLKEQGLYGVKGGIFLTDRFLLEGNFGYLNHFELEGSDPESRGLIWEASGSYHLFQKNRFAPYVTAGVGGLTAVIDDDAAPGLSPLEDGDTFFNFSYGGGVKAVRLWGPLGLRGDVRGRTLPNFHGESSTWLEVTGGITLNWGER